MLSKSLKIIIILGHTLGKYSSLNYHIFQQLDRCIGQMGESLELKYYTLRFFYVAFIMLNS